MWSIKKRPRHTLSAFLPIYWLRPLWNVAGTRQGLKPTDATWSSRNLSEENQKFFPRFGLSTSDTTNSFQLFSDEADVSLTDNYHASRALISSFFTSPFSAVSIWRMGFDSLIAALVLYYYLESSRLFSFVVELVREEELAAGIESFAN